MDLLKKKELHTYKQRMNIEIQEKTKKESDSIHKFSPYISFKPMYIQRLFFLINKNSISISVELSHFIDLLLAVARNYYVYEKKKIH